METLFILVIAALAIRQYRREQSYEGTVRPTLVSGASLPIEPDGDEADGGDLPATPLRERNADLLADELPDKLPMAPSDSEGADLEVE